MYCQGAGRVRASHLRRTQAAYFRHNVSQKWHVLLRFAIEPFEDAVWIVPERRSWARHVVPPHRQRTRTNINFVTDRFHPVAARCDGLQCPPYPPLGATATLGCCHLALPESMTTASSAINCHLRLIAVEDLKGVGKRPLWRRKSMNVSAKSSAGHVAAYSLTKSSSLTRRRRLPK